ncbi:MAG TPA: sensor domain-containing diguanylate cyclase [Methylotenera sp.]|nr:sensor domain-containing diguanylate cyclase [Methylotenera sp.]
MQAPAIPSNEAECLHALQASQLLDSEYEAIFDNLTALVSKIFDVPIVAISLVDSDRQWFKSIYGLDVCETNRDISFCGHVVFDNHPLIIENALNDDRFADNPLVIGDPNIMFYAGVPLRFTHADHTYNIGTLCIIDTHPRQLSDEQLKILKSFAYQVESLIEMRLPCLKFESLRDDLAVDNVSFDVIQDNLKKLRSLSDTDPLTGLRNRRSMEHFVQTAWHQDKRKSNIALMLIDLDGFKAVNDQFGHSDGDKLLISVAKHLKKLVRKNNDYIARYGGDEFVLVAFNLDENSLAVLLEKLKSAFKIKNDKLSSITISIGAVLTDNKEYSCQKLIQHADEQLYIAKKAGKNRFEITVLS